MGNVIKKFYVENKKYRRLHLPIIFLLFLSINIGLVCIMGFNKSFQNIISQPNGLGWYLLMDSYLMAKLIFTPILLAVVISRIVDIENSGDMWKILNTSGWSMGQILDIKFFSIFFRYVVYQILEWSLFIYIGKKMGIVPELPIERFSIILVSIMAISFTIMNIHYYLALRYENQLIGLSMGVLGTIAGIIGSFLPISISKFIPYSYYIHLRTTRVVEIAENKLMPKLVPLQLYPLIISLFLGAFIFLWARRKIKNLDL